MEKQPFTEIYLISALLSYGYIQVDVDRTNVNRQIFTFEDGGQDIYLLVSGEIKKQSLNLKEFENKFLANSILLMPSYPSILKTVKYSIHSYRNDKR